jgi:DNA-binding MarR family transcriptional regulator
MARTTADVTETAAALRVAVTLLVRQLRQASPEIDGELTLPQRSALARLDRLGPTTSAALARVEQISPQSMGATLAALEAAGLVARKRDPVDGRQVVMSLTPAGEKRLRDRRTARVRQFAAVLAEEFTPDELEVLAAAAPLLERLGLSL